MVVDLKRKAVKDWLDTLKVSNKTLSNIQSCLRSALSDAMEEELIDSNPLAGWTYARKERSRTTTWTHSRRKSSRRF
ncbi:phage integrase SAM-like domain-containing protein [Pseudomonas aeruginosa]